MTNFSKGPKHLQVVDVTWGEWEKESNNNKSQRRAVRVTNLYCA